MPESGWASSRTPSHPAYWPKYLTQPLLSEVRRRGGAELHLGAHKEHQLQVSGTGLARQGGVGSEPSPHPVCGFPVAAAVILVGYQQPGLLAVHPGTLGPPRASHWPFRNKGHFLGAQDRDKTVHLMSPMPHHPLTSPLPGSYPWVSAPRMSPSAHPQAGSRQAQALGGGTLVGQAQAVQAVFLCPPELVSFTPQSQLMAAPLLVSASPASHWLSHGLSPWGPRTPLPWLCTQQPSSLTLLRPL